MLTLITEFLTDLPMIGSAIKTIASWFTKTTAQKQADTAVAQQNEAEQIAQSGRPKWD